MTLGLLPTTTLYARAQGQVVPEHIAQNPTDQPAVIVCSDESLAFAGLVPVETSNAPETRYRGKCSDPRLLVRSADEFLLLEPGTCDERTTVIVDAE